MNECSRVVSVQHDSKPKAMQTDMFVLSTNDHAHILANCVPADFPKKTNWNDIKKQFMTNSGHMYAPCVMHDLENLETWGNTLGRCIQTCLLTQRSFAPGSLIPLTHNKFNRNSAAVSLVTCTSHFVVDARKHPTNSNPCSDASEREDWTPWRLACVWKGCMELSDQVGKYADGDSKRWKNVEIGRELRCKRSSRRGWLSRCQDYSKRPKGLRSDVAVFGLDVTYMLLYVLYMSQQLTWLATTRHVSCRRRKHVEGFSRISFMHRGTLR